MPMTDRLKALPGLRLLYNSVRMLSGSTSQSDEHQLIARLMLDSNAPRRFIEFGFHPREFNSAGLVRNGEGLLLDGDISTISIAKKLLPATLDIRQQFITLDSIGSIVSWLGDRPLGLLSIDVDGNDFWFAEALLPMSPAVAVIEYNASLGMEPVTVPYDPSFLRGEKHETGWYHGASLVAIERLGRRFGYSLVATSDAGGNAFLLRQDLQKAAWPTLDPVGCYRESRLRNHWAGNTAADQWARVADMPFVLVDNEGKAILEPGK